MQRRITLLFSIWIALASQVVSAQEYVPAPQQPLPRPDWLEAGPPSQPCADGGYFYDGMLGHNQFSNWYARGEVLFLERSTNVNNQVVVQTDIGATPLINTGDFDFAMEAGLSLLVGRRLDSDAAWELSYFGLHEFEANAFAAGVDNLDLPGGIGAGTDFDDADAMDVLYRTRLNNAEFNFLRDHARFAWLAGFRYVNWEEEFNIGATNDADISNYNVQTSNNLLGGQFGARAFFHGKRLDWEITGKVGIFGNIVQQRQMLTDDDDTLVLRDTSTDGSAFSFVGDLNVSAIYRLNHIWSIRAGYNIMEVTGLALAPDQIDFTATPTSGRDLNVGGDVFLHGANIGVEAIW